MSEMVKEEIEEIIRMDNLPVYDQKEKQHQKVRLIIYINIYV